MHSILLLSKQLKMILLHQGLLEGATSTSGTQEQLGARNQLAGDGKTEIKAGKVKKMKAGVGGGGERRGEKADPVFHSGMLSVMLLGPPQPRCS